MERGETEDTQARLEPDERAAELARPDPDGSPPSPAPLGPEDRAPEREVAPAVVPRWVQLVVLPIALLGVYALARAAGPVLLVFLVASVIALILNPLVKLVHRPLHRARLPRGAAVFVVYVGFFLVLAGLGALVANPVADQVRAFQRDVPGIVDSANASLADVQDYLDEQGIDLEIKAPGEDALTTLQRKVLQGSDDIVRFGQDLLVEVVEVGFALVLILVISIYMLLYGDRIGRLVSSVMPKGDGSPDDNYTLRVQKAVFGYVRGQILFSVIMGTSAGIALWIFGTIGIFPDGKTYALFFGAFFGLMELIPYVGPVLGAAPPVLVALFQDPLTAVWVTLLFIGLQQLEGHVVAPTVFGRSLRINPLLVIAALLIGGHLYGIVGAFVALPLAAVARETVVYLRRHLVLEPWGTPSAAAIAMAGRDVRPSPLLMNADRCAACGAVVEVADAYCRACGTPVAEEISTSARR